MISPQVLVAARRYGLGEPEMRFRHRPSVFGTILFVAVILASMVLLITDVLGPASVGIVILTPTIAVLWMFTAIAKLRGGIYVFAGGIADVYGDRIHQAWTWREISDVGRIRILYMLNFIPIAWQRECKLRARNGNTLKLTGAYEQLNSIVSLVHQRIR